MTDLTKPAKPDHNIQGGVVNIQALKILDNVLRACLYEQNNHQPTLPQESLMSYKKRASLYTGVPLRVFESLTEESTNYPEIDLSLHLIIRKTLKKFYSKEEEPTCRQLYDILRAQFITNHSNLRTLSTDFAGFANQLVQLGYETVKTIEGGHMIMENPKLTFERYRFVKKMMKARTIENKIYYLSVRIYDAEKQCMVPINKEFLSNPSQWNVLTLYHLISKDGYENGLFSYNYDTDHFFKWILQILVPLLKPSSLIVIDNKHLLDVPENEYISKYHPKKDMLKWLKNHNLPCTSSMPKAELFELIEKCSVKLKNNTLENILQSFGHDVLYVPDQMHDLSPTQSFWKDMNNKLKSQVICASSFSNRIKNNIAVRGYLCDEISLLSSNIWEKYDQEVKKAEEDFFAVDNDIENYLDKYKFDYDSIVHDSDKKWHTIAML